MSPLRARRRARAGFGLMEVVFAVAIVSTALLALQATVSGAISSAGNSVNRRAAREVCRAKVEEILAGVASADGGGEVEGRPGFQWSARTEDLLVGMPETATETVKVVIVELSFPVDRDAAEGEAGANDPDAGRETIQLATVLPAQESAGGPAPQ